VQRRVWQVRLFRSGSAIESGQRILAKAGMKSDTGAIKVETARVPPNIMIATDVTAFGHRIRCGRLVSRVNGLALSSMSRVPWHSK